MYGDLIRSYVPGNLDNYAVSGLDGVRTFPTQPNQRYVLFDRDEDVMYFFNTDAANIKSEIRRCKFIDHPIPKPEDIFVSKDDFNVLREELTDVKQSIQQLLSQLSTKPSNSVPSVNDGGNKRTGNLQGKYGENKGSTSSN